MKHARHMRTTSCSTNASLKVIDYWAAILSILLHILLYILLYILLHNLQYTLVHYFTFLPRDKAPSPPCASTAEHKGTREQNAGEWPAPSSVPTMPGLNFRGRQTVAGRWAHHHDRRESSSPRTRVGAHRGQQREGGWSVVFK